MENSNVKKHIIPPEFLEPNWRFWSFILLAIVGIYLMMLYPVPVHDGLTDPFYSPTVLVLPLVVLFRATCYAYRKDYHRHLFDHPNSCLANVRLDDNKRQYTGETRFFRIEDFHRYFMYTAWAILPFFYYDIYVSWTYSGAFTLTLGSIILLINTLAVTFYTFSCHSVRHLTGGYKDCFSCPSNLTKKRSFFTFQSKFNEHHEALAWTSLILFIFTDLYLRGILAGLQLNITFIHLGL
ncbi:MAG: succinate dehydrogenase [Thermoplasmataceae archaeon]